MPATTWGVNPMFFQAMTSGAELGARLRAQQAAEQNAANQLRLSFAEQSLRQQAHEDTIRQHQAELALRQGGNLENIALKQQLEEGRNNRAADSLEAHGQRTQDWIDSRIKLANDANALKATAEAGKNTRAANSLDNQWDISTNNEEGRNTRAAGMLSYLNDKELTREDDFQQTAQDRINARMKSVVPKMLPMDAIRLHEKLKTVRGDVKLQSDSAKMDGMINRFIDVAEANIPKAGAATALSAPSSKSVVRPMPKNKSDMIPGQPYQTKHGALIWNGESFDL